MVYSMSYCENAEKTKKLLQKLFEKSNIKFKFIEMDKERYQGDYHRDILYNKTRLYSNSYVFINGVHLGGNSDLVTAQKNG